MSPERSRDARTSSDRYGVLAQLVLAITSSLALILATATRFTTSVVDVGLGVLIVLYLASAVWLGRRLFRTRYYDFRMALTGQSGAGKTVFANLLYNHLMNGREADYEFTAESKSAIATYQAIRGIGEDVWPPSTTTGSVLQRDGILRHRRIVVDLEIGDSAGEHWLQLAESGSSSADADYLQWVLSADALIHVIPADRLVADGFEAVLRSDVDDLRLAAQLMRNVSRGRYELVPILVVISKMDLLPAPLVEDDMLRIFSGADADFLKSTQRLAAGGSQDVPALLDSLSRELATDFRSVSFTYSSAGIDRVLRTLGSESRPDVPQWIVAGAVDQRESLLRRIVRGS
jgi:hypothetical protein